MLWRRTTAFRDSLPPTASVLELQGHFKRRHSEERTGNVSTLSHLTTVGSHLEDQIGFTACYVQEALSSGKEAGSGS